jgi:hypothetical protein
MWGLYLCFLCLFAGSGVKHILNIWVTWMVSYKRQELFILYMRVCMHFDMFHLLLEFIWWKIGIKLVFLITSGMKIGVRVMVFNTTCNNISFYCGDHFFGGGNRGTQRKPLTCSKSLTNFITYICNCMEYTLPWTGFKLTILVVSGHRHLLHRDWQNWIIKFFILRFVMWSCYIYVFVLFFCIY